MLNSPTIKTQLYPKTPQQVGKIKIEILDTFWWYFESRQVTAANNNILKQPP